MDLDDLFTRQRQSILDGDAAGAVELAQEAIQSGADVARCVDEGFVTGIREVGRLWAEGEYFLPELVQGAEAMKAALKILRPVLLETAGSGKSGGGFGAHVVLGTVKGDIHDIGKTLVATVLEANGYQVTDLGRDVEDEAFVEAVAGGDVAIVGMSALLTTTMGGQERVIDKLRESGLRDGVKVLVGGAPVSRGWAKKIGSDGTASDAVGALALIREVLAP
jgi:corrinoid protein of di/trimethylamine methyltransferase